MQRWKDVKYAQHHEAYELWYIYCNFICDIAEASEWVTNYRCLYITLFLWHLALDFDHANVDEKAASHPWTADLALGQFIKTVWVSVGLVSPPD